MFSQTGSKGNRLRMMDRERAIFIEQGLERLIFEIKGEVFHRDYLEFAALI